MNKRKQEDDYYIKKKIRKLELKIEKQKRKLASGVQVVQSESEMEDNAMNSEPGVIQEVVIIPPEPGTSSTQDKEQIGDEREATLPIEDLPEEFLLALGEEGIKNEEVGQKICQEVANRWTNIIISGIKKENFDKIVKKYLTPENFPKAVAPKVNTEISSASQDNVLKRDKKFEYRQNLTGKVLSCLGALLTDIMKGNINSVKLIEGINDAGKILSNMSYYDSMTRRHLFLTSLHNCVKQAVINVPIDSYLFEENLAERLKAVKSLERSGNMIQKKPPTKSAAPTKNAHLNWKGPSRTYQHKENKYRGGPPRYQNQQRPAYPRQQQQQQQHFKQSKPSAPARRR